MAKNTVKKWIKASGLCFSILFFHSALADDLLMVYHQAQDSSPILMADQYTYLAAAQAVPSAVANLMPQLSFNAALNQNYLENSTAHSSYQSSSYGLSLTQQLLNLNDIATVGNAKQTASASRENYASLSQQFILTVATQYFAVLQAADNLASAKANELFLKKTLEQTKQKFEAGLATYTDVKQAEADYDRAIASSIQNQNNLDIAKIKLMALTRKHNTNLAKLKSNFPLVKPSPASTKYWVALAEKNNLNLQAGRYTTQAALKNVDMQNGNLYPTLALVGGFTQDNFSSNVPSSVSTSTRPRDLNIGLELNWTVFQSGSLYSKSLQAAKQYEAAQDTQDNLYRSLMSQTRQDYRSVLDNIESVEAYHQAVISNQASLREFEAKYRVGSETIVNVLNAADQLYQARQNYSAAQYSYILSALQLKSDAGILGINDLAYLNKWLQVSN